MQTRHEAKHTLSRIVREQHIGPYVGKLGEAHVYVVAPSRRAVVSENKVTVYAPDGRAAAKTYTLPKA